MAWRPNRLQWVIIWATVLTSAHFWLKLRFSFLFGNGDGGWGLPAYVYPAIRRGYTTQLAVVILVIGVLLTWQTSGWSRPVASRRQAKIWGWLKRHTPSTRTTLMALAAAVGIWLLALGISKLPPPPDHVRDAQEKPAETTDAASGISAANSIQLAPARPVTIDPSEVDSIKLRSQEAAPLDGKIAQVRAVEANVDPCRSSVPGVQMAFLSVNNGEQLGTPAGNGHGELTITNGNREEDAAVIVANSTEDTDDRLIFVRAGMVATMRQITPGQYKLTFQFGLSWDSQKEDFVCDRYTKVFDQPVFFTETRDPDGIGYHELHITLTPVPNGKAATTRVNDALFRRRRSTP